MSRVYKNLQEQIRVVPWQDVAEIDGELMVSSGTVLAHKGAPGWGLCLHEVRIGAGTVVGTDHDRILYLREGSLLVGNVECTVGDSVRLPAGSQHSVRAGVAGADYLRFATTGRTETQGVLSIFDGRELPFVETRDAVPPEVYERLSPGERMAEIRMRHSDGAEDLTLLEVRIPANGVAESHAHAVDEIICVVGGSMYIGRQRLGPGSSLSIPRLTLYNFRAGPDGLTFLNFRRGRDEGVISKEELVTRLRNQARTW